MKIKKCKKCGQDLYCRNCGERFTPVHPLKDTSLLGVRLDAATISIIDDEAKRDGVTKQTVIRRYLFKMRSKNDKSTNKNT